MLRVLICAVLCLVTPNLASCATTSTSYSKARSALERAEDAYARIRGSADMLLPFLPPATAARVRLALDVADRALAAARLATTVADQLAALKQAETATAMAETITRLTM